MKKLTCGSLRVSDEGKEVSLSGWITSIRDHGELFFIDIRDWDGTTQVTARKKDLSDEVLDKISKLRSESVVTIKGTVHKRPEGTENKNLKTGDIEVHLNDVEILNLADPLPYLWKDHDKTEIAFRLKYRYIDLRHPKLQYNIRTRAKITSEVRRYLEEQGFVEIETPMLTKSTPEGARDYLVPSRIHKGKFYALPQSPQLFKQLLMCSGFEKYFQIARCFRDEDLRPDRQPEFTQIDIEMSFITQDDIISLIEGMLKHIFKKVLNKDIKTPFPRMKYWDALDKYGLDKPDTRFGMELVDIKDLIPEDTPIFKDVFEDPKGIIKAILVEGYGNISKKKFEKLRRFVRIFNAKDVGNIILKNGTIKSPLIRYIGEDGVKKIIDKMGAKDGDLILFIGGPRDIVYRSMGELRNHLAKELNLIPEDSYNFLWIVDFPLFEWSEEEKRWTAMHHPFTSAKPEFLNTFDKDPEHALANAYDIVLNGYELGGGSIRIHQPEVQRRMFKALGIPDEIVERNFSFLMEAFRYGAPPHGGIALGLDRLVMLITKEQNIQDVIAFPKLRNAKLPIGDAPSIVTEEQLEVLGIELRPEVKLAIQKEIEEEEQKLKERLRNKDISDGQ